MSCLFKDNMVDGFTLVFLAGSFFRVHYHWGRRVYGTSSHCVTCTFVLIVLITLLGAMHDKNPQKTDSRQKRRKLLINVLQSKW